MAREKRTFTGLTQYRAPFNYELAGKHFRIVMDDGSEYSLFFLDGETVQWAKKGEPFVWDSYEALKGDETTYLVHWSPEKYGGKYHYALVLDTAQRLVTFVLLEQDSDPALPRLMKATPYFGAIKVPGRELPKIRHHLSGRMVGKHIFWKYHPGFAIQHIYYSPTSIRASSGADEDEEMLPKLFEKQLNSPDPQVRKLVEGIIADHKKRAVYYPYYEEPCFHIWISDTLNLLCFMEEIMMRRDPEHNSGGGGILLLQDVDRVTDVGLCYNVNDYSMVTAYGEENEDYDPLDDKETIYNWEELTGMESLHWEIPEENGD